MKKNRERERERKRKKTNMKAILSFFSCFEIKKKNFSFLFGFNLMHQLRQVSNVD